MSQEKKGSQGGFEMSDAELEGVNGGVSQFYHVTSSGKKYKFKFSYGLEALAYLCPNCHAEISSDYSDLKTYKCWRCGAVYTDESQLSDYLNLDSGCWEEVY